MKNAEKGAQGEAMAARYLENLGYEIIHRNLRLSRFEIDLICRDGNTLVFVEVKNSVAGRYEHPATWINGRKQEHLRQAAIMYIDEYDVSGLDLRFDAVTITQGELEHFQNAFQV